MSLLELSATELLDRLNAGEVTARETAEAYLDQVESHDDKIGAFLHINRDLVMQQAEQVDSRRKLGEPLGPLAGLPVALKDNLCVRGERTTCASQILKDFIPPYDATVIAKLKAAGAVLFGKTNLDEFAMGGSTENSALRDTRNPWNLDCVPGGSSGGSAASVAAAMAPLALGSDTGGSIRQPAAFCGVTGLKPTYGRVSRYGLVAFASSLDQIGPLARTAEDAALLLEVIAGHDSRDATSLDHPVPRYREALAENVDGMTIGIPREFFGEGLDSEVEAAVRAAIKVYESQGAKFKEVSLPHSQYAVATYYIIAPSEASSNLARYDGVHYGYRTDQDAMNAELKQEAAELKAQGDQAALDDLDSSLVRLYRKSRAEGFGIEVKRRIMLGTYALSAFYKDALYLKALKVRRLIRQDFDQAFGEVDVLLGPCTPTPPFKVGEKVNDPLSMYLTDLYTVSANLAGIAGISIPCGQSQAGLPIGLQLLAPPLEEARLLRTAHQYQQATDWHTRRPSLS